MHTRDYSDETSRVIDEEVGRILRKQEERATDHLTRHRHGLDAVAAALLENETIDGAEVGRLVDGADGAGGLGGDESRKPGSTVPHFGTTEPTDAGPMAEPDGGGNGRVAEDPTTPLDRSRLPDH